MNNSAAKVGEIFTEAGAAFNKLAEMTMMLHPMAENTSSAPAKTPVKRKAADERPVLLGNTPQLTHNVHTAPISQQVTLNMLNAHESEMDGDGLNNAVKLEFESSTEEVCQTCRNPFLLHATRCDPCNRRVPTRGNY